jgi:hypothetical protein
VEKQVKPAEEPKPAEPVIAEVIEPVKEIAKAEEKKQNQQK